MTSNPDLNLINFYESLNEFISQTNIDISDSHKVISLFRAGLELAINDKGIEEAAYLLARIQYTTLGITLGKQDSFEGIVTEFCEEKNVVN